MAGNPPGTEPGEWGGGTAVPTQWDEHAQPRELPV